MNSSNLSVGFDAMDLVKVPCPACSRVLINPVAGADGHVRCSNCGQHFSANVQTPQAEVAPVEPARTVEPANEGGNWVSGDVPPGRPPQPASYGAAVLLGYLLLFVQALGSLLMLVFVFPDLMSYTGMDVQRLFGLLSFVALIASLTLVGMLLVRAASSLRRMDAAALELAWRLHALPQPPPVPPGSELPYILPCMVAGGTLVMIAIVTADQLGGNPAGVLFSLSAGPLLFLLGLAFADIRRFCWRMKWLADAIGRATQARQMPASPPHRGIIGLAMAAAVFFSLGLLTLLSEVNGLEFFLFLILVLVTIGASISIYLLLSHLVHAADAWCVTGRVVAARRSPTAPLAGPAVSLNAIPVGGAVWSVLLLAKIFEDPGLRWSAVDCTGVLFGLAVSLLAVCMGLLLNRLHLTFRLIQGLRPPRGIGATHVWAPTSPSFLTPLSIASLSTITVCWLSALVMSAGAYDFGVAWIVVSGLYYYALVLVLLGAMSRGLADCWEDSADGPPLEPYGAKNEQQA